MDMTVFGNLPLRRENPGAIEIPGVFSRLVYSLHHSSIHPITVSCHCTELWGFNTQ